MDSADDLFNTDDATLIASLKRGNHLAFEQIYHRSAAKLLQYIFGRVRNRAVSEELLQEVFLSLWARRAELNIRSSLESYLFGAAKYQILGYIRSEKMQQKYADHLALFAVSTLGNETQDLMDMTDLRAVIEEHLASLPPKCQQAFRLSRFEHKNIAEVATEMGISTRTVENYLTQALKHLRTGLTQHQWLQLLLWLSVGTVLQHP